MGPWYDEAYFRATGQRCPTGLLTDLDRNRHPNAPRKRDRFTVPAAIAVLVIAGAAAAMAGFTGGVLSDEGSLAVYSSRP